jgi:uncharacterized spore protein YtfJ
MQEAIPTGENIINNILDRVKGSARVEIVYGESREIRGKTIVPIAAVAYGFGAGAGTGAGVHPGHNGGSEHAGSGGGGGGGGGVRVQPIGVLEITDDETRIVPIIDWTRVITSGLTALGVWMIVRAIFRKR